MNKPSFALGVICATFGALLWGFSGTCAQFLYEQYQVPSMFVTVVRSSTAGLLMVLWLVLRDRKRAVAMLADRQTLWSLVVFGAGIFCSQFFYVLSVSATNAGTATVLQMSYMVFVLIATAVIARKLPSLRDFCGFLCAMAGVWLIATQGDPGVLQLPAEGLVFGVLNGIGAAMYVMWPRKLFARWGSFGPTAFGISFTAVYAAVLWVVGVMLDGQGFLPNVPGITFTVPTLDAVGWLVLIGGMGVLGTMAAFGLYLHGVSVVGSVKGGLLGAFEPLGAMVISAVWLGNVFTGADWIGFLLMMAMLFLVTVPGRKPQRG